MSFGYEQRFRLKNAVSEAKKQKLAPKHAQVAPPAAENGDLTFVDALGRVRRRKFDWDECVGLKSAGWSRRALAHRYGVSLKAIDRVVYPSVRRSGNDAAAWRQRRRRPCERCGALTGKTLCRGCASRGRILRDTSTPGGPWLWCPGCERWRHETKDFVRDSTKPLRGRRNYCRACDTARKREYRERKKRAAV